MSLEKHLRFASSWRANHDDGYSTRVKEPARHGTVQLSWCKILTFGNIVNAVDEGRTPTAITGCVGRNFSSAVLVSEDSSSGLDHVEMYHVWKDLIVILWLPQSWM